MGKTDLLHRGIEILFFLPNQLISFRSLGIEYPVNSLVQWMVWHLLRPWGPDLLCRIGHNSSSHSFNRGRDGLWSRLRNNFLISLFSVKFGFFWEISIVSSLFLLGAMLEKQILNLGKALLKGTLKSLEKWCRTHLSSYCPPEQTSLAMITSRIVVVGHSLVCTVPLMGMSVFRYVTITAIHGNMMHYGNIFLLNDWFKLKRNINVEQS